MGRRKQDTVVEEVENLEEQVSEETEIQEEALAEAEAQEAEEVKPKRKKNSSPRNSRKKAVTPETQVELATEAMQKTMDEMVKHWSTIQSITGNVASQLEKVAHIVKPSLQDFVSTNDSLVVPKQPQNSLFATRFTAAASIIAVLLSLVSMSLSQSARTVALNAEATRVANSQLFHQQPAVQKPGEIAIQRPKEIEVFGPKARPNAKAKHF